MAVVVQAMRCRCPHTTASRAVLGVFTRQASRSLFVATRATTRGGRATPGFRAGPGDTPLRRTLAAGLTCRCSSSVSEEPTASDTVGLRRLDEALRSGTVKMLGGVLTLQEDGTLRNESRVENIGPVWSPVVDAAVEAFVEALQSRLVGVYLRGSLPRGLAVPKISDVDMIAFAFDDAAAAEASAWGWRPRANGAWQPTTSTPSLERALESIRSYQASIPAEFPFCRKIEMRVVLVDPDSSLGEALCLHRKLCAGHLGDHQIPPVLPANLPNSFMLATQSICLWGVDIPKLLPVAASVPPPVDLSRVHHDVEAVLQMADDALQADQRTEASKMLRWSLRRYLREIGQQALAANGQYSRDLFYCCEAASTAFPHLADTLLDVLCYVIGDPAADPAHLDADGLGEYRTAATILGTFCLEASEAQATAAIQYSDATQASQSTECTTSARVGRETVWDWQHRRAGEGVGTTKAREVSAYAKLVVGGGTGLEKGAVHEPPPPVQVAVGGSIQEYRWDVEEDRTAACQHLRATAAGGDLGPAILRGAADRWRATSQWSLDRLVRSHGAFRGVVRVAPERTFMFCQQRHVDVLRGAFSPPSWTTEMSLAEFAANVQSNSDYTQAGLRFYLQAPLDAALLADIDLSGDPFRLIGDAGAGTADRTFSQAPRMWISPAGSVSPLHYDLSPSFLTQIRGDKRFLFYSPDALPGLYPYPNYHPLRRRCQLDLTQPDLEQFPAFAPVDADGALVAHLKPGDVLFFPPRWAHYVESLDLSISVTCRFKPQSKAKPSAEG